MTLTMLKNGNLDGLGRVIQMKHPTTERLVISFFYIIEDTFFVEFVENVNATYKIFLMRQ